VAIGLANGTVQVRSGSQNIEQTVTELSFDGVPVTAVRYSTDGKWLAVAEGNLNSTVNVYAPGTWERFGSAVEVVGIIRAIDWSQDSIVIVV
jgi:hypothetical protein